MDAFGASANGQPGAANAGQGQGTTGTTFGGSARGSIVDNTLTARTLAALDAPLDVANRERLSARRRALGGLACAQRRLSTWGDAHVVRVCDELEATVTELGPKAHDALAALLALKVAAPTPTPESPLPPGACERWCARWEAWSRDGGSVEADAVWLTLLCRARKDPAQAYVLRRPAVATKIVAELIRAAQAGVGAARGATRGVHVRHEVTVEPWCVPVAWALHARANGAELRLGQEVVGAALDNVWTLELRQRRGARAGAASALRARVLAGGRE